MRASCLGRAPANGSNSNRGGPIPARVSDLGSRVQALRFECRPQVVLGSTPEGGRVRGPEQRVRLLPPNTTSHHQQPEVNYLPRFSPQLSSLERKMLSIYRAGEIDLFENLDIVHIRLLVAIVCLFLTNLWCLLPYRGSSLKKKCAPLGPYRRPMPWVLGGS